MSSSSVLHIVASLQGGAARQALILCQALKPLGWRCVIAAPNDNRPMADEIAASGCEFHRLPRFGRLPIFAWRAIRNLVDQTRPDVIHLHGHRAAILARMAIPKDETRPRVVYTVHGYHPPHYPGAWQRFYVNTLERWQCAGTDAYICVSHSTLDDLTEAVPNAAAKSAVIYNAIPHAETTPALRRSDRMKIRDQLGISEQAFVIGSVGRLQWQKGFDRLLDAFQWAGRETDMLLIVGEGPERRSLKRLARRYEFGKRCIFAGAQADTRPWYHAMDLFVLPSLWEGLPLTILEAWSAGTPVIATDAPGSRDIIRDGLNGLLAVNRADGIAAAIKRFHDDPTLERSLIRAGLEELNAHHDPARMAEETLEMY